MCQATVGTPVFVEPVVEIVLVAQGCLKVCFGIAYTQAYNATETVVYRFGTLRQTLAGNGEIIASANLEDRIVGGGNIVAEAQAQQHLGRDCLTVEINIVRVVAFGGSTHRCYYTFGHGGTQTALFPVQTKRKTKRSGLAHISHTVADGKVAQFPVPVHASSG